MVKRSAAVLEPGGSLVGGPGLGLYVSLRQVKERENTYKQLCN